MRTAITSLVLLVGWAAPAHAWDGAQLWYDTAAGAVPGGGGILGTGGAHDHGITCGDCHVERAQEVIGLDFEFDPPMGNAGPDFLYAPGQRYRVVARLANANLGSSGCAAADIDSFAAAFETDAGAPAGTLESDVGQSAASCPPTWDIPQGTGSTGLYRDCAVVFGNRGDVSTWTFYWTAPGSGAVKLTYGGVDGDCDMMSMGDAVVSGSRVLRAPMAAAPRAAPPRWAFALAALALLGLLARKR
jgi:hypothetical protein